MKRALLLVLALAATGVAPLSAQDDTPLRTGRTLSGTLESDSEHSYTVELDDGMFVFGNANQLTVDVVVTVVGPDGEDVARFDSPARGEEVFTFTTEASGTYRIVVTPFEQQQGDYEITLEKSEPVATDPEDRVDQLMTPFSGDDTPGAVIGVMNNGEVAFERGYGMANLSFGIEHEVGTPTNIGSVSKQFTAMTILLLQKDGKLSIDDDVREYIPELPDFGEPVLVRHLMSHVSGYREIYNEMRMTGWGGEDFLDRDEAIRIVRRQPELQDAPNSFYNYNNTAFILLSHIVERVTDKTFPEFMKERIFEPLGMHDTRMKYQQGEIIPGASTPYVQAEGGGWRAARDLGASAGAGGIYTTWPDMTKWMLNYTNATVGGPETIELLTTRNVLVDGDTTGYAKGIGVNERRGQRRFTHTGGDIAHRTYFSYFPDLQAGIFMSSNNASFGSIYGTMVPELEELFFGDRLDPLEEEEEGAEPETTEGEMMSVERMEAIAGDWLLVTQDWPIELTTEDGQLFAQARGQGRFPLLTTSDTTATFAQASISVVFHFDGEQVDSATFTQGRVQPMIRYEVAADAAELTDLAGRYYSRELEVWLDIGVEDDGLVLQLLRGEPMELTHRNGLSFTGPQPYATVDFQVADNGDVTGLIAGNGRTKGILFVKQ